MHLAGEKMIELLIEVLYCCEPHQMPPLFVLGNNFGQEHHGEPAGQKHHGETAGQKHHGEPAVVVEMPPIL